MRGVGAWGDGRHQVQGRAADNAHLLVSQTVQVNTRASFLPGLFTPGISSISCVAIAIAKSSAETPSRPLPLMTSLPLLPPSLWPPLPLAGLVPKARRIIAAAESSRTPARAAAAARIAPGTLLAAQVWQWPWWPWW